MKTLLLFAKANFIILVNAGSLIGTTVVTSVFGFAYWWLAARLFPPSAVGFASAAISAMMLLGTICMLGLGTLLTGELPRQAAQAGALISAALITVGAVGGCIGILLAMVAPLVSVDFQPLRASSLDIMIFASGVSLTTVTLVLDQALIGLLRGELQFWRNTLFAVVKLAALFMGSFWLLHKAGMAIYATWLIGNAVSLLVLLIFAVKERGTRGMHLPQWQLLRRLGVAAVQHHILNLVLLAPPLILPILVTIQLSSTENAWFYVSFMLANFIFGVPYALSTVLYAVSSAQPAVLAYKARLTLSISFIISVVAGGVLFFGSELILGLFGHIYAEQADWCLRILSFGVFPLIIVSHYIAICRARNQIVQAMLPITVATLLEVAAAAAGAYLGGLSGLSLGWIIAVCCKAIYMFPTVYKALQPVDTLPVIQHESNTVPLVAKRTAQTHT